MKMPGILSRFIDRRRYNIKKSTLIAHDGYTDEHNNSERHFRNTYLYRSRKGVYFTVILSQWKDDPTQMTAVTEAEAKALYTGPLSVHPVSAADAFPAAGRAQA